jgi:60 kDa SS-A/Ro ribonucleoprotein
MANKNLFKSMLGRLIPFADATNLAGGPAFAHPPKQALAQYAATGCLNKTFYAEAEDQLYKIVKLCEELEADFIAKTAVFCRERGFMKDMPALLCAILSIAGTEQLRKVFPRVIDNGKMLRNFVQILRSGQTGRKSLGSLPKKLVLEWLDARTDEQLFKDSVGNDPSLADVLKMVHPKPKTKSREALFGYLIGREHNAEVLPELVKRFEAFKKGDRKEIPEVPFQMLTALELKPEDWAAIAKNGGWQMTRMNLNTFARHEVFAQKGMADLIAKRLSDEQEVLRARVFPYQLLAAFRSAGDEVPKIVKDALQDAMEIAIRNVPAIDGQVYIFPDVSGSMQSPVTGFKPGSTSAVRCVDVAALVAAAFMRRNKSAEVIPFEQAVVEIDLNARDSVMTNADKLAKVGGGGTNCSAPLALLNKRKAKGDLVVYVSDNQSWVDAGAKRGTETLQEWSRYKQRNPDARLVCIDLQPYGTTQAAENDDVLNIGGFSDQVFTVTADFAAGRLHPDHWVGVIEATTL